MITARDKLRISVAFPNQLRA